MVLPSGLSMSEVTQTSKYIDNFPTQKAKVDDIEIGTKHLATRVVSQ